MKEEVMVRLSANISLLFGRVPVLERFNAARQLGYNHVESWWPFASAVPATADVDEFLSALDASSTRLTGLNFFAGDMVAGQRGVLSDPERAHEFRDNVDVVVRIAEATGCRIFNALYGQRTTADIAVQDEVARESIAYAAAAVAPLDGVVVLESLKSPENGSYPLRTLADAEAVRGAVATRHGAHNVGLLFDTFHLAGNGEDLAAGFSLHAANISHVQIADFPGRGAPGTGGIDFRSLARAIDDSSYNGFIGVEFAPGDTVPTHAEVAAAISVQ
jgi:hydroxypyruvate isomerase